jgi:peptidoglycan/LPS O-acetylase OafA/YrhL
MPSQTTERADPLPESASLLLDVVRFSAALLVVMDHFTLPEFALGYPDRQILGMIAVPVFFVLSGFVIRYVTRTRESRANEYFVDRASRIYSVVLPAMAFTLVVSLVCFALDRRRFLHDWSGVFTHPIARLVFNLLFVSQAWGRNTIPFLNIPFWSLGYECIYYLLYGFLFYCRGWRRLLPCILIAALIGPQVMLLFPIWWLGCWLYDAYAALRGHRIAKAAAAVFGIWLTLSLGLALAGRSAFLDAQLRAFWWFVRLPNPLRLAGLSEARASLFAVAIGTLTAIILFFLLLAVDPLTISRSNRYATAFRRVANGTFTIYLMHFPLLVLLLYVGVVRPEHWTGNAVAGLGLCVLLTAAAVPVDRFKLLLRNWLRALVRRYFRAAPALARPN